MAVRYTYMPARFEYLSSTFMNLTQIQDLAINYNPTVGTKRPAGIIDDATHILTMQEPEIRITTQDLDTVFQYVSITDGLCVAETAQFPLRARKECGTLELLTDNVHDVIDVAGGGFLMINSLDVEQDSDDGVQCELMFYPKSNLSDPILNHLTGQPLNTYSPPAFNSAFYMGHVRLSNIGYGGMTGWNYTTGITFSQRRFDGQVYPSSGLITQRSPSLTLRGVDTSYLDTFCALPMQTISGSIQLYMRKGDPCGDRVADATSEHILLSFSPCATREDITVTGNEDGTYSVTFRSVGAPTITTGVTIPALNNP